MCADVYWTVELGCCDVDFHFFRGCGGMGVGVGVGLPVSMLLVYLQFIVTG